MPSTLRTARLAAGPLLALSVLLAACGPLPSPSAAPSTPPPPKLIVGALHVGSIDDHGYNQAMHEGLLEMQRNVPGLELIEQENVPEEGPQAEQAMEDMIQHGAKLIFPQSFGYLDAALTVASRHPPPAKRAA
jgi:basic membrane lipoprotein Med (substrate-binding protein (PBP1-ABC) superfamily)